MKLIRAHCIGRAHELIVAYIYRNGYERVTVDGEKTLEIDGSCIIIDHPLTQPMISERAPFGEQFAREYASQILNGTKSAFDYTYHDRLFEWKTCFSDFIPIDQIEYIVQDLCATTATRRAVASLWIPSDDILKKNVPCLNLLQCKVVDNKLCMDVVFRSNDMCSAFGQNAFGLVMLQRYIADRVGIEMGRYKHISLIPHIYIKRDATDIKRLIGSD